MTRQEAYKVLLKALTPLTNEQANTAARLIEEASQYEFKRNRNLETVSKLNALTQVLFTFSYDQEKQMIYFSSYLNLDQKTITLIYALMLESYFLINRIDQYSEEFSWLVEQRIHRVVKKILFFKGVILDNFEYSYKDTPFNDYVVFGYGNDINGLEKPMMFRATTRQLKENFGIKSPELGIFIHFVPDHDKAPTGKNSDQFFYKHIYFDYSHIYV